MNSMTSVISGNCGPSTTDQRAHAVSISMFLEFLGGRYEPCSQKGKAYHVLRLGKGEAKAIER